MWQEALFEVRKLFVGYCFNLFSWYVLLLSKRTWESLMIAFVNLTVMLGDCATKFLRLRLLLIGFGTGFSS